MTSKEAKKLIGHLVAWPNMDPRIDKSSTILERVGAHGIAIVSYRLVNDWGIDKERCVNYRPVKELYIQF